MPTLFLSCRHASTLIINCLCAHIVTRDCLIVLPTTGCNKYKCHHHALLQPSSVPINGSSLKNDWNYGASSWIQCGQPL